MGWDTLVAWTGVLLVVFLFLLTWMEMYDNYVLLSALEFQKEAKNIDQYRTDFRVRNVSSNSGSEVNVSLENVGSEKIIFNDSRGDRCFDVFLDNEWVKNWSVSFIVDPFDKKLWNPEEVVKIRIRTKKNISSGEHVLRFITCNGVGKSYSFTD